MAQGPARREPSETDPPEESAAAEQSAAPSPPTPAAPLAERIRQRYGPDVDPGITLDEPEAVSPPPSGFSSEVLRRLAARPDGSGRYRIRGEVDHGGMGAILRVWDEDLRRHLAMKVIVGHTAPSPPLPPDAPAAPSAPAASPPQDAPTPPIDPRLVGRFLEEAQVTGQLDHPGIVPVHELGLDAQGRVFFTMKLVKGEDLKAVFARVHRGEEGWSTTRVLGLLLKVCEAMSYAHAKHVIHRDLKPANVMVGKFGEVFVMDWGLAKVLGREDSRDVRIRESALATTSDVHSERQQHAAEHPDSPLVTMDGDVVGTPAYMSPEQARGKLAQMGPPSDVYAVGAMLYHLITARVPFVVPDAAVNNRLILAQVQAGPPKPVHELAPDAPAELVAICERAMTRDPGARYADMSALAGDLRAYLEQRVVSAYETGAIAELRKWVVRNKPLAASLAAGVLLLLGGLASSLVLKAQAESERANVLRLSAFRKLEELERQVDHLWPATPEMLPKYDAWLASAAELVAGLGPSTDSQDIGHRAQLARLRERALPQTEAEREEDRRAHPRFGELAAAERDELDVALSERRSFAFADADADDAWWHDQLTRLVTAIEAFADPQTGLVEGISEEHHWGIARRRTFATSPEQQKLVGREAERRWAAAIASVADREQCPAYDGLQITPQRGLLPIGRDRTSGLWEFWHGPSGDEPLRGEDGKLVLTESSGIVLVLIPGGTFWMGAQKDDPDGRNYDPRSEGNEPLHEVTLSPYFVSKYEMTRGQWRRFTGSDPSPGGGGSLHPVTDVRWNDAREVLPRLGLDLPTEAQWERACRGGTETAWWTGDDEESLAGKISFDQPGGFGMALAVDDLAANPYGLHHVHGNVWEWCLDAYEAFDAPPARDPVNDGPVATLRVIRGGGFASTAANTRSSSRGNRYSPVPFGRLGVRPAQGITP